MSEIKQPVFKIFFFKRYNTDPIPGYDQLSIIALNYNQAAQTLIDTVKQPEQFYLDSSTVYYDSSEVY